MVNLCHVMLLVALKKYMFKNPFEKRIPFLFKKNIWQSYTCKCFRASMLISSSLFFQQQTPGKSKKMKQNKTPLFELSNVTGKNIDSRYSSCTNCFECVRRRSVRNHEYLLSLSWDTHVRCCIDLVRMESVTSLNVSLSLFQQKKRRGRGFFAGTWIESLLTNSTFRDCIYNKINLTALAIKIYSKIYIYSLH